MKTVRERFGDCPWLSVLTRMSPRHRTEVPEQAGSVNGAYSDKIALALASYAGSRARVFSKSVDAIYVRISCSLD